MLTIEACKQVVGANSYTFARLLTKGKAQWTYGRIEARIKMPYGNGMWPAFWMLGANIDSVPWPGCGEIDVVEMFGGSPLAGTAKAKPGIDYDTIASGTLHWPDPDAPGRSRYQFQHYALPERAKLRDDFHVYGVEWSTSSVRYFVDGTLYQVIGLSTLPTASGEIFRRPFFLVLNLAVGGQAVGPPDASTAWPQQMVLDWVRVYQR